ncbi:hypothetical protein OH492_26310 [Vibrio chagasii]|nr:hypothetical protein [Vibrio chagasii]
MVGALSSWKLSAVIRRKGTGRTPLDVLLEVLNGKALPILYGFGSCPRQCWSRHLAFKGEYRL